MKSTSMGSGQLENYNKKATNSSLCILNVCIQHSTILQRGGRESSNYFIAIRVCIDVIRNCCFGFIGGVVGFNFITVCYKSLRNDMTDNGLPYKLQATVRYTNMHNDIMKSYPD